MRPTTPRLPRLRLPLRLLALCWLSGALLPRPATALAPSNLELVTGTTRQAVREALEQLDLGPEASASTLITVHEAAPHPANWLVSHLLTSELLERGLAVGVDGGKAAGAAADSDEAAPQSRLDLRVVDLSVDGRSSLLGGAIARRCRVVLRLELYRGGEQVGSGEGHVEHTDSIPKNQLDALQHSRFSFAKTDLEKRSWGKYVEPVIITTVLGSLIYLFFSNR